jgi:hypothetical protein
MVLAAIVLMKAETKSSYKTLNLKGMCKTLCNNSHKMLKF